MLLNEKTLDADRQAFKELKCNSKEKENGRTITENDGQLLLAPPQQARHTGLPISAFSCKETVTSTITMKGKNNENKENNAGAVTDWSQQVTQDLGAGKAAKARRPLVIKNVQTDAENRNNVIKEANGPHEQTEKSVKRSMNNARAERERSSSRSASSADNRKFVSVAELLPAKRAVRSGRNEEQQSKRQAAPNVYQQFNLSNSFLLDQSIEEEASVNEAS